MGVTFQNSTLDNVSVYSNIGAPATPAHTEDADLPSAKFENSTIAECPETLQRHNDNRARQADDNWLHVLSGLNGDNVETHMGAWQHLKPTHININPKGIHLTATNGDKIHIQKNNVNLKFNQDQGTDDATVRAMVLHAKENQWSSIKPDFEGNDALKARVWAHCQAQGVKMDWEPSPEVAARMQPVIDQLNVREDKLNPNREKPKPAAQAAAAPEASTGTKQQGAASAAAAAANVRRTRIPSPKVIFAPAPPSPPGGATV